jgi:hypothetical protein
MIGLGIIILQGVSSRKSLAGVNIMLAKTSARLEPVKLPISDETQVMINIETSEKYWSETSWLAKKVNL